MDKISDGEKHRKEFYWRYSGDCPKESVELARKILESNDCKKRYIRIGVSGIPTTLPDNMFINQVE